MLLRAAAILGLMAGMLMTGVAAATFAGWALFWLSGKGAVLCAAAVLLTYGQHKLLGTLLPVALPSRGL